MLAKMTSAGRALYDSMKLMAAVVPGSPNSKMAFRSKAFAASVMHGCASCMINICPAELACVYVFRFGDPKSGYTFSEKTGVAIGRLPKNEARRFVAANFWTCADFYFAYKAAFNDLLLGWPLDAQEQRDPNCLFGKVLAFFWSDEESGRGGAHGHNCTFMPLFQAQNLIRLSSGENGRQMQRRILELSEALACAMLPQVPLSATDSCNVFDDVTECTTTYCNEECYMVRGFNAVM